MIVKITICVLVAYIAKEFVALRRESAAIRVFCAEGNSVTAIARL